MAIRAKEDTIVKDECLREIRNIVGVQLTDFYGVPEPFILKAAALAVDIYESRRNMAFRLSRTSYEHDHITETLWAATLFSLAANFGVITYDGVAESTNPEVADYLQFTQINRKQSVFKSIEDLMADLAQCNSALNYGPIFTVLAEALTIVDRMGEDLAPIAYQLPYSRSLAAKIWGTRYAIRQFNTAQLGKWSEPVRDKLADALRIVEKWQNVDGFPPIVIKRGVSWSLNLATPNVSSVLQYIEL